MAEKIPIRSSSRFPGLLIPNLEFTDKKLGRGSDATVYEVIWNGTVCAAKRLHEILLEDDSPGGADKFIGNFEAECITWSRLRHPGVVQFLGVYLERDARLPVLIMEKMDTSLRSYCEVRSREEFPLHLKVLVLRQVAQALAYLHNQHPPLVHFDVSPNNVLLNVVSFVAKLTDFGMSRVINPTIHSRKSSIKGTLVFMAPEVLQSTARYSDKVDVFSFGNVILTTITHEWPNPSPPTQYEGDQLVALDEFQRRERYFEMFTAEEKQLFLPTVHQCLENRPDKRPSSVVLAQELRRIESSLPTDSHVAAPIERRRQQLSAKEDGSRHKDKALAGEDDELGEKKEAMTEKDEVIQAKDDVIKGKNEALWHLDMIIRDQDEALREKDEELRKKDEALREKHAAIQVYQNVIGAQPSSIEQLGVQLVVAEQVQERSHIESPLLRDSLVAAPIEQLRQQLAAKEEECRQKDEVIKGKDDALWHLHHIIDENAVMLEKKTAALRQKDATIQAQQDEIQQLRRQPAMVEKLLLHEADLEELCYIPFGIKAFTVTPDGGIFPLGTKDASVEFPPGAVEEETSVRYAIILHGPFEIPANYKLASVVVYLNLGTATLVQPIYLSLADWCQKKQRMDQTDLMFIRAPHALKEGKEKKYHFSTRALQNADSLDVDVLQIAESKCLYAKVLEDGRDMQELFCASPLHQIEDSCLRVRILFTWFSHTWIKLLEKVYMKEKNWQKHPEVPPLAAQFRINTPVQTVLSDTSGPGWKAIQDGVNVIEKDAITSLITRYQPGELESDILAEVYPPAIRYRVAYDKAKEQLTGTSTWSISFPDIHASFSYDVLTAPSPFGSRVSSGYVTGPIRPPTSLLERFDNAGNLRPVSPTVDHGGHRSFSTPSPRATSCITSRDLLCQRPTPSGLSEKVVLRVAGRWRDFGLQLGFESYALDAVKSPNGSNIDHCLSMLEYWLNGLQGSGLQPRTWSTVLGAVAISCGSEVRRDITEELNM